MFPHPRIPSHTEVMEMEFEFFNKNFAELNAKQLMDHIPKMASGKLSLPPATLSLVYGKLLRKVFTQPVASGSGPGKSPDTLVKNTAERYTLQKGSLKCCRCGAYAGRQDLLDHLYCPRCPPSGWIFTRRPIMQCPSCNHPREEPSLICYGPTCTLMFL